MPIVRLLLRPAALAVLVALPAAAPAQARSSVSRDTVPVHLLPPAGKCRIWMTGVPAAQQPAPTDCATALRQRPANGVVLYGPAPRDGNPDRFDPSGGRGTTGRGDAGPDRRGTREVPAQRLAPSRPAPERPVPERSRPVTPSSDRAAPERPASDGRPPAGAGTRAPSEPRKPPAETKRPE